MLVFCVLLVAFICHFSLSRIDQWTQAGQILLQRARSCEFGILAVFQIALATSAAAAGCCVALPDRGMASLCPLHLVLHYRLRVSEVSALSARSLVIAVVVDGIRINVAACFDLTR